MCGRDSKPNTWFQRRWINVMIILNAFDLTKIRKLKYYFSVKSNGVKLEWVKWVLPFRFTMMEVLMRIAWILLWTFLLSWRWHSQYKYLYINKCDYEFNQLTIKNNSKEVFLIKEQLTKCYIDVMYLKLHPMYFYHALNGLWNSFCFRKSIRYSIFFLNCLSSSCYLIKISFIRLKLSLFIW